MSVSAPKIKAFLGKIKEDVLDCGDADVSVSTLSNGLALLEILQRGVIPTASCQDDASKIVDAIRSAAGKTLLDSSSSLPKPLLAGSSAMAGMVAEKFAKVAVLQEKDLSLSTHHLASAMARCQDVHDNRLMILLQIFSDGSQEVQRQKLLILSEGCFLRAASFQPDPPQMWKRTMDVILARLEDIPHPLSAAYPISQLIRIAKAKNNPKRVAELTLRLVECLLSNQIEEVQAVSEVFVSPYRPVPQKDVKQAQMTLNQCDLTMLEPDGVLHYKILDCRILLEFEELSVHDLAQQQLNAAKNRGAIVSLESCIANARRDIWISKIDDEDPLDKSVSELRDRLLSSISESSTMVAYASETFARCVTRLEELSQVIGLEALKPKSSLSQSQVKASYDALYFTVHPVLLAISDSQSIVVDEEAENNHMTDLLNQMHLSAVAMLEVCALALSFSLWMKSSVDFDGIQLSLIKFTCDFICALSKKASIDNEILSKKDGDENLINGIYGGYQSKQVTRDFAMISLNTFIRLTEGYPPTQEQADKALELATLAETNTSAAARYGTIFLLLLDAWSGFQHTPWCHCTLAQARTLIKIARMSLTNAVTSFGRKTSKLEAIILDIAEADAESGVLGSGLNKSAKEIYQRVFSQASELQIRIHVQIVRSHCLLGLSRLALTDSSENADSCESLLGTAEENAISSLRETNEIKLPETISFCMISLNTFEPIRRFHRSFSRQLTAEAMLRNGKPSEAESLLLAAMEDTPNDFDAAMAMGLFRMRVAFFPMDAQSPGTLKAAQVQLLKVAKLYPNKAPPFALLGYWFEENGDVNRAVGCYSKALLIQPSHPVAGRGIIRLTEFADAQEILGNAVARKSHLNGWAWKALGIHHAMVKDDSANAVICFQEALRCKDIVSSHDLMHCFYAPSSKYSDQIPEDSTVWCELAACYVRLGRQTAAIRAFKSAWSLSGERMNPSHLILWAQVQLQLGQHDEAISTFTSARRECDDVLLPVLSYGLGCALFSASQSELMQGKAQRALQTLLSAVSIVSEAIVEEGDYDSNFICSLKLLGDIHTFGAAFPSRVFLEDWDAEKINRFEPPSSELSQLSFISRGEDFYLRAEKLAEKYATEELAFIRASLACDCGVNILHQAQKICQRQQPSGKANYSPFLAQCSEEAMLAFGNAACTFKRSIQLNPLHAPAWCGLGSSLIISNPLLAQHAFSRAVQLDKTLSDAWANLSILYAGFKLQESAFAVIEELTQIADTPMIWICRGIMLEQSMDSEVHKEARMRIMLQASEAYQASVRVIKNLFAQLGIGITCAVTGSLESKERSFAYMTEYVGNNCNEDVGASLIHTVMELEQAIYKSKIMPAAWKDEMIQCSLAHLDELVQDVALDMHDDCRVKTVLLSQLRNSIEKEKVINEKCLDRNFQAQIMEDPKNGKLWLATTKSLVMELFRKQNKTSKTTKAMLKFVESVITASERAVNILSVCDKKAGGSCARDVSEALSLRFYVKLVHRDLNSNSKKASEESILNEYDVQRALMMWPKNRIAREVL